MEATTNLLLLLFVILYPLLVFVGRTFLVWRRTKHFPITYGMSDSAHDFLGRIFAIVLFLNFVSSVIYFISSTLYQYLIPLPALELEQLKILGLLLAYASMVWTVIAQAQMGQSWRIGIDTGSKTEMVRHGLFKLSRHPIYFGVMATSLSLFLVMPNVLNLILFLMLTLTLNVQARLEEEYLTEVFGDEYTTFRNATRRWF